MPLALLSPSPHHSPAVLYASPVTRQSRGETTPRYGAHDSGYFKGSSSHSQEQLYETESGSYRSMEMKARNTRSSGPLDYSSSRKVKYPEGSSLASSGPSSLPRFAVSRSGPIAYK